jgi:uncharacterized membrane protein YkoI
MSFGKWRVLALVLTCAITAQASAQERRLKRSDLPPAVQKTADEQSNGATVQSYSSETEGGQLEYEVAMTVHGHSRDVSIAADGTILVIEEQVALDSLPAPVRAGLQQRAGSGKIIKVELLTKRGAIVAYEAQVRTGTKRSEIQVGPDGKPLAHEE